MKKYFLILTMVFAFTSCDEDLVIYDTENGQAIATITNGGEQTLPVPDTGDTAIIEVGVTTVSDVDRSISISIDNDQTTADPSEYTIDQTSLVIPAGEFVGQIRVDANFAAIPATGFSALVVNVDDVSGADMLEGTLTQRINFFRFCPFDEGVSFTGDYMLETLATGIFGETTLTDGVVTISQGATVADRQFSIAAYPAFGAFTPFNFQFSLICDEVVVQPVDNINVGCGGGNAIGPSATVMSSYDSSDDSELIINFVDDVRAQCEGVSYEVSIRLTKI